MPGYQPFAISNFRTGFDQAVEPWLLPRDGWQVMKNAHLYRGVVETIAGYDVFAFMSYRTEIQLTGTINGVNKVFTGNLAAQPSTNNFYIQATINAAATQVETFTDDGTGTLTGSNGGTGTIDYNSPWAVSVTFGSAAPVMLPAAGPNVYNAVILQYDSLASQMTPSAIMGIKPYYGSNGDQQIMIFDQHRMGILVELQADMAELQEKNYGVTEIPHEVQELNVNPTFGVSTGPFTGTLAHVPIIPGQVIMLLFDSSSPTANLLGTIVDNGAGKLTGALLDATANNYINYATGAYVLNFLANRAATQRLTISYSNFGSLFSGSISDFFSVTNYNGNAFFTNNKDNIMYFNGTEIKFLNTNLTVKLNTVAPYDITQCLHVQMHRERLLLLAPIVLGLPALNAIFWSRAGVATDFTNDERLLAPTSEYIKAYSIINYDLVVRFINSEYVFRYTSDAFSPFRWDKTNSLWRCDAPYSAINYDSYFSSVGLPGIVASDGVNVIRIDENIPDFTLGGRIPDQMPVITIDPTSIQQCYGERFDDFKEGWLCYRGSGEDDSNSVQGSDAVLAFNYQDETYSIYTFPFSCLGFGRIINQLVWSTTHDYWVAGPNDEPGANWTWNSYTQDNNALIDLAGGFSGEIYQLGESFTLGDADYEVLNPVKFEAISKNFNPFIEQGELVRLGYVDFLVSNNAHTKVRIQFYINDLMTPQFNTYSKEETLTFTGDGQSKVWKRCYFGGVGKSVTIRIYQADNDFTVSTLDQPIRIHAMTLWMKPAGRIYG